MAELPTGTVTFLFTDVEGSTRLLGELGRERYAEALAEHRHLLRRTLTQWGGVEVDTQGDAFFYAFRTAPDALGAAQDAQEALEGGPILVRMGIHTGCPHRAEEGYVGADVHRAARIAECGHGGQVLVSAATAGLALENYLRDLGEHRLKDLSVPERIYQIGERDFPRLKTLNQTNLPVPSTPFLGREKELAEVVELLSREDTRLVTLTGTGGTGKTRLALQAAGFASDAYPNGVWWVPLAGLRDSQLVLSSASQALGVTDTLAGHIGEKEMLILFDNFEHVLEASSGVGHLLSVCRGLDVLVTSREPIHLAAEHEYPVPSMARAEAVAFFSSRARAARPDFEANGVISEICHRLDDLPLALELAAARVRALSPNQILERLDERFPLLTGGPRDVPHRQRTLKATIDWSYDLLTAAEQRLFCRISVFAGGCTLDAAEKVAGTRLDILQSLVEKSLVRYSNERCSMLESIREYATDRLEKSREANEVRSRHAHYFLELAESAGLTLEPEGEQRYSLFHRELDNVRAALDWWLEANTELALRLAVALEAFWIVTDPSEGMRWLDLLLKKVPDAPLVLRASAYRAYGSVANPAGDDELAERFYQQSLDAFRELGDHFSASVLLLRLGYCALYRGDDVRAGELAAETLALSRAVGNRPVEAQALGLAGEVEYAHGNRRTGADLIERSANLCREADFPWWRSRQLRKLADCMLETGQPRRAEAFARESLQLMRGIGDRQMMVFALARLARISAQTGEEDRAGLLWGAIEAEEARRPMGAWAKERHRFGAPILTHEGLRFERGRKRGSTLSLDEAAHEALTDA
jgi:predicted ATPase